jgi:hypothetical protein
MQSHLSLLHRYEWTRPRRWSNRAAECGRWSLAGYRFARYYLHDASACKRR